MIAEKVRNGEFGKRGKAERGERVRALSDERGDRGKVEW